MKRIFVLSTFICFAIICACQKQDSAAEAQLAQRKADLETREKALDQREKALVEKEKAVANSRIIQSRQQARNPAEVEAEREKRLQQLPPELRALIPNREQMNSAKLAKEREAALQARRPIPSRRKRKETGKYNSFLPNFRPSFVTARCWMLEPLKKVRQQQTGPSDCVVSKRNEKR